jgi:drug/metabolite transporter (DMT)-like permease
MNTHLHVHLKLLGMALLWGASWPAGKLVAQHMAPLAGAAMRFSVAVVLLAIWLLVLRKDGRASLAKLNRHQWQGLALGGLVGVFGYALFFMYGLKLVPSGRASLVVTVNPVFTTLLAVWLFKERFNWKIGVGMFLAALGASVVLTHGAPWKLLIGDIGFGELLLLGCVFTWTGYSLIGRKLLAGIDALTATTVAALFGGLMLWAGSFALDGFSAAAAASQWSAEVWFALLFLAAGATVLAYSWYFEGISALGAGGAAAYISLVPVFGVLTSSIWLREPIDWSLAVGGLLAISGMAVMNKARA